MKMALFVMHLSSATAVPRQASRRESCMGIGESRDAMESNALPRAPIIGGPVCTRTADRSLHVNLLPTAGRLCTFDCIHCPFPRWERSAGWQPWPRPGDIGTAVANALNAHPEVESITVSGPGEPTLHPLFGGALAEVLSGRGARPLPVRVVTNGTTLLQPRVRRLLEFADERIVRIDAGGERISRPRADTPPEELAAALRALPDFSVESIFVEGPQGNTNERDVDAWIERLAALHPRRVYVTTIAEAPLDPSVRRADAATLTQIADQLHHRTGLDATVLP
jgi:wyosine [tRNA(Phe)-imidazoG37] synthetase (radical SAM superfamily)